MSLNGDDPRTFFGPLTGRTTTFLLEGRDANLAFAKVLARSLAQGRNTGAILDLDAFYSSNSDRIFSLMDPATARSTIVRVPDPGSEVEVELSGLFGVQQKVLVIDSLNTLYHLISLEDGSSRSRKLAFALASLSYFARTNEKAVVLSMYRREGFQRGGTGRSISGLSDATASVVVRDGVLEARSERGSLWPGGSFSSRIPSESPGRSR
jgi:hypothetical protein